MSLRTGYGLPPRRAAWELHIYYRGWGILPENFHLVEATNKGGRPHAELHMPRGVSLDLQDFSMFFDLLPEWVFPLLQRQLVNHISDDVLQCTLLPCDTAD